METHAIHFVRVTADDRSHRYWAAATARDEAVDRVLDSIPEGWSAVLVDKAPAPLNHVASEMTRGKVWELRGAHPAE